MISGFFKLKQPAPVERPRDARDFDLARDNQRKQVERVDAATDVLSQLVRNMKGPKPNGSGRKGS